MFHLGSYSARCVPLNYYCLSILEPSCIIWLKCTSFLSIPTRSAQVLHWDLSSTQILIRFIAVHLLISCYRHCHLRWKSGCRVYKTSNRKSRQSLLPSEIQKMQGKIPNTILSPSWLGHQQHVLDQGRYLCPTDSQAPHVQHIRVMFYQQYSRHAPLWSIGHEDAEKDHLESNQTDQRTKHSDNVSDIFAVIWCKEVQLNARLRRRTRSGKAKACKGGENKLGTQTIFIRAPRAD